jgi:hypothetical protein
MSSDLVQKLIESTDIQPSMKQWLINICKDPRTYDVKSTGRGYIYQPCTSVETASLNKGGNFIMLSGITAKLKELFWPDYNPQSVKKSLKIKQRVNVDYSSANYNETFDDYGSYGSNTRVSKKTTGLKNRRRYGSGGVIKLLTGGGGGGNNTNDKQQYKVVKDNRIKAQIVGLERGGTIHRQIRDVITYSLDVNKSPVDVCVMDLFNKMKREWNWTPVFPEFNVYNLNSGTASSIDFIAYDRSVNQLCLVEVKTGYEDIFLCGSKPMKNFDLNADGTNITVKNSPLEQAMVQLVTTCIMFLEMYPYVAGVRLWVVWISKDGAKKYPVNSTTYGKMELNIMKHLNM